MILSDMIKDPVLPENLQTLSEELEKLLRLVNNALVPAHLDTAERYLAVFTRRWALTNKKQPNPILVAIGEKILLKKNVMQVEDVLDAERTVMKVA